MIALHLTKFVATHCATSQGGYRMVPHARMLRKARGDFISPRPSISLSPKLVGTIQIF